MLTFSTDFVTLPIRNSDDWSYGIFEKARVQVRRVGMSQ